MSTTIRTVCPVDGEVDLTAEQVKIVPGTGQMAAFAAYTFLCTGPCHTQVVKPADDQTVRLLVTAGVEFGEPETPPAPDFAMLGPALTQDDILDFHLNFESEMAKLLGEERPDV